MRPFVALLCWPVLLPVSRPAMGAQAPRLERGARIVRRERRMTLEGAGMGLLAGTLTALAADPEWVDENGDCTTLPCIAYQVSPHLDTRLAVFGVVVVGVLLGAIVGSEAKTATWAPVHLERLTVGPAPAGGFAMGVRITF